MIQAKVINLLPGMSLGQVVNPVVDNSFLDYVKTNFQNNYAKLQELGSNLTDTMQGLFNHFTNDTYINQSRNIALEMNIRNDVSIHGVNCETIYDAGYVMAGYVMANPTVYDMYSKFRVDGYEDMFTQMDIGESNPYKRLEYLQTVDEMVQFKDDGYEVNYLSHSGEDLTSSQKLTILDSWDCAEFLIENGIDPTSRQREEI